MFTEPNRGFVLAYLSARLGSGWYCWENGNGEVGLCARASDENDEHFTRAVVELAGRVAGPIDLGRVHVLGMSGGASMAWKLGCHARSLEITGAGRRVRRAAGCAAPGCPRSSAAPCALLHACSGLQRHSAEAAACGQRSPGRWLRPTSPWTGAVTRSR